jgi:hypothetical protein
VFTEPLPRKGRGIHYTEHLSGRIGFMKYSIEMDPGAMIYIPSFIKIYSGLQNIVEGIHMYIDTQTAW